MKFNLTGCQVEHLLSFLLQENWRDITETSHQASGLCRYLWSKTWRPLALSFMFYAMHLVRFFSFFHCSSLSNSTANLENDLLLLPHGLMRQMRCRSKWALCSDFQKGFSTTWNNCLHFKFEVALNSYLDKNRFVQDLKVRCVWFSGISRWDYRLQPTNYPFLYPHFHAEIAKQCERPSLEPLFNLSILGCCRNMEHGGLRGRRPTPYVDIKGSF